MTLLKPLTSTVVHWGSKELLLAGGVLLAVVVLHRATLTIYRIWFHPLSKFPGPKVLAATNLPSQWGINISGKWYHQATSLSKKYGPVVRIGPDHLLVDGSVGWPQVFGHRKSGQPEFPKVPGFFVGNTKSIIVSNRENHRRQRRQLGHAFSEAALFEQQKTIMQYIDLLLDGLSREAEKGVPLDIVRWLNFTTFDIIGDLAFSESFHGLESGGNYHPWVAIFFELLRGNAAIRFGLSYPRLMPIIKAMVGGERMKSGAEHRRMSREKAENRLKAGQLSESGRRDFMTYMLKEGKGEGSGMSRDEIMQNSPLLVIAGSETTATALSGFFFYNGTNPDIMETVKREVREAFVDDSEMTIKSVAQLPYLHACIEESLRVYPPVVDTPPRVSPGTEVNGEHVPAGTTITVSQWATYRNPDNFTDPDEYRPQRWLPASHPLYEARYANDNLAAHKPFSYGTRDCIGKNLAYLELRLIAARILHRFDVELAPGQEDWHSRQEVFIVWRKPPLNIMLKPRVMGQVA